MRPDTPALLRRACPRAAASIVLLTGRAFVCFPPAPISTRASRSGFPCAAIPRSSPARFGCVPGRRLASTLARSSCASASRSLNLVSKLDAFSHSALYSASISLYSFLNSFTRSSFSFDAFRRDAISSLSGADAPFWIFTKLARMRLRNSAMEASWLRPGWRRPRLWATDRSLPGPVCPPQGSGSVRSANSRAPRSSSGSSLTPPAPSPGSPPSPRTSRGTTRAAPRAASSRWTAT